MVLLQTRMPSFNNSPRMRSAPHRRLSLAISRIKATVSWEILGVGEGALDLYFQKSLKPWRCHRRRAFSAASSDLLPLGNPQGARDSRRGSHRPIRADGYLK